VGEFVGAVATGAGADILKGVAPIRQSGDFLTAEKMMDQLPEYREPPVVETALAIEVAPLEGWNVLHYGILWEEFRKNYPVTEVHPSPIISANAGLDPPLRYFFINQSGSHLIQVRAGAFVANWRATPAGHEYPRYEQIRPAFEHDLKTFNEFLTRNRFPLPEVWKCEVTYVNHLLRGREWKDSSDVQNLFPVLRPVPSPTVLTTLSRISFIYNYELAEELGALQIQMVPGLRGDGTELLQLTLTAAGKPRSSALEDILEWLDHGRRSVVLAFSEFTSAEVQREVWKRI
jgi:uncharacterized protein (TIGR04255 family)